MGEHMDITINIDFILPPNGVKNRLYRFLKKENRLVELDECIRQLNITERKRLLVT